MTTPDARPVWVEMRRTADGAERAYADTGYFGGLNYDPGCFNTYIWDEGNFSCDCNRRLFWDRAGGEEDTPDGVLRCGDGAFRVRIWDEARTTVLYSDWEERHDNLIP